MTRSLSLRNAGWNKICFTGYEKHMTWYGYVSPCLQIQTCGTLLACVGQREHEFLFLVTSVLPRHDAGADSKEGPPLIRGDINLPPRIYREHTMLEGSESLVAMYFPLTLTCTSSTTVGKSSSVVASHSVTCSKTPGLSGFSHHAFRYPV